MAHLFGSWSNSYIDVKKIRLHSDKSAANTCKRDRLYYANAVSLRQEKDPLWCNWSRQQHRFWQLFCCNRDDALGHLARRTLPQTSVSWCSNLLPSQSQNLQFDQWDERSFSVRSGQAFWTFGGLPSHRVPRIKSQCRSPDFARWNDKLGWIRLYQIPISTAPEQFCLWLPCFEHGQPVCPRKDPNPITCDALLQIIAFTQIQAPGRQS